MKRAEKLRVRLEQTTALAGAQPPGKASVRIWSCFVPSHDGRWRIPETSCSLEAKETYFISPHLGAKGYFPLFKQATHEPDIPKTSPASRGKRTCDCRTKMPWFSSQVKYLLPCTVPSFLPFASSRMTPTHFPVANRVAPT